MPGALDSVLRPVAEQLIEQFGGSATYRQTAESFNASTGKTSITETTHSIIMTPPEPYAERRIDGDAVQLGDLKTFVKAQNLGFTPAIQDKITFNGQSWQVVRVEPLYSGALPAAYVLQLRN